MPLKPKKDLPVPFVRASDLIAQDNIPSQVRSRLQRSNAVVFDHPVDVVLEQNRINLRKVEKQHPYAKKVVKRKYEEFLADQETSPLSDDEDSSRSRGFIAYQQYKLQRKSQRIAELRNRLRAVGLTNLQLSERLTVANVDCCALRGANQSLYQHNLDLQDELKRALLSKHQMWAELAHVSEDDAFDDRESDHIFETEPISLNEAFLGDVTPSTEAPLTVPDAPPRNLVVPTPPDQRSAIAPPHSLS